MNIWRLYLYALALAVVAFVAGCEMGREQEHDRREAEVAQLKAAHAAEREETARSALERLQAAQARADALARGLAAAADESDQLRKSRDDALRRATTGRVCLSADAVRLLNTGPAIAAGPGLPEAAGSAPASNAGGAATDLDVSLWSSDARSRYAECARRLNALIDYEEGR